MLNKEIRSHLVFVLWVVLLGPAAYVAAIAKVQGPEMDLSLLLRFYLRAIAHFLVFSLIFASALVGYGRWRRGSQLAGFVLLAAGLAVLALGVGGIVHFGLSHFVDDGIIAGVVLLVQRLYQQLVISRLDAEHHELVRERAHRAEAEARWCSLESRVRPHFLFNTLSSIRELMHRDVGRAEAVLQHFAALLRFTLDSEHLTMVPLEQELRIVAAYLEIEQMRLGPRLAWSVEASPESKPCSVLALSVLTLVENSVKYAIAPRRSGGRVNITAELRNGSLEIEVGDDGPGFPDSAITAGHGLDLLLRRLKGSTVGGGLNIRVMNPGVVVSLCIPASSQIAVEKATV
ncbi:MAG: histidine kinase [Terracidiphilus sp.]